MGNYNYNSSIAAEMGDRLATIHMACKVWGCCTCLFNYAGEWRKTCPYLTQSRKVTV